MRLYLVRHAQSVNNANVDRLNQRQADPPLTELGHQQAERLAAYLQAATEPDRVSDTLAWRDGDLSELGYQFDRVITSAMFRALQTTQPLAAALALPVQVWWDVCEQGGIYRLEGEQAIGLAGLTRAEIQQRFSGYDLPPPITEAGWWQRDRETVADAQARAATIAQRLLDLSRDAWANQTVLLVSHGMFSSWLLHALLNGGKAPSDTDALFFFYNTSLTRLDFFGQRVGVRYTNRIPHLPDQLVS